MTDSFAYAFLRTAAKAELCFSPNHEELSHWFESKCLSYDLHGADEAPHTGACDHHVFEFMISAYHDVDLKAGATRVASTKFRDTEPEFYAAEWLYKAGKYAPWRLIGASAR